MASEKEIREKQTERLFDLLEIQETNKGITINNLNQKIIRAKASMSVEDIAHVEKMIRELYQ